MGDTWRGVETITKTGETGQNVTVTVMERVPNVLYTRCVRGWYPIIILTVYDETIHPNVCHGAC